MGVVRTAISLANTPETTAQALLAVALNPDRTKAALIELKASKDDHDKSRIAADAAKQAVADGQREIDVRMAKLSAQETDLWQREQALAAGIVAHDAEIVSAENAAARRTSELDRRVSELTSYAALLADREGALRPREEALDIRESDLRRQKKEASDWLSENRAALESARKLLAA